MQFSFDFAFRIQTERNDWRQSQYWSIFFFSFQKASKVIDQTEVTPLSEPFSESDIYSIMFSDSTRGDISPSDLGSGEGSGDEPFTLFSTDLFSGSDSTIESESTASGISTEGKTGTTEFGTEVTESSDITVGTTFEGSGTTIEEESSTSPEEGSGASSSDISTDETTESSQTSTATAESGSAFPSDIFITIFKAALLLCVFV